MKSKMVYQLDEMDCGPACLAMITKHYGNEYNLSFLRNSSYITKNGSNLLGISQASEKIGFKTAMAKLTKDALKKVNYPFPCILFWDQGHFVVLDKITKNKKGDTFSILDPAHGSIKVKESDFLRSWISSENKGFALFLSPTDEFFKNKQEKKSNFQFLFKYLTPFKAQLIKVFVCLFLASLLTLAFPFTTQALVDRGIANQNLSFVTIILLIQLSIFFGQILFEVIRDRLLLFIGTRINIDILTDFLKKLMKMPLKYFDSKQLGDLLQRIQDHKKIEVFLTSQSIFTLFSLINFSVFFFVLAYYSFYILALYLVLTGVSLLWVLYFQRRRETLDYEKFHIQAKNQNTTLELVSGMQEIKLNEFEDYKRDQWKELQEELFKVNIKVLHLDQFQLSGFSLFNNLKNILISFFVALGVIKGNFTLGEMFSVSYIIGEMNSPVGQLIDFIRSLQDAKLSFLRMEEIHSSSDIEIEKNKTAALITSDTKDTEAFTNAIEIKDVAFQYGGPRSPFVLDEINCVIPKNKVTAIVGTSGSGKTTLIKLLLKYYLPTEGKISVFDNDLASLDFEYWRQKVGVVMQDGRIFSESVERNIATSDVPIDEEKLQKAIKVANLYDFIEGLPLGLKTRIGPAGNGISGGQKQRILIARAVYKNPDFLFFDEATSSLDAKNEKVIIDNLAEIFKNKTVIVVAHRLSTVKDADQIIVLENGALVECGTHRELIAQKKYYYTLVKNQLDLGK